MTPTARDHDGWSRQHVITTRSMAHGGWSRQASWSQHPRWRTTSGHDGVCSRRHGCGIEGSRLHAESRRRLHLLTEPRLRPAVGGGSRRRGSTAFVGDSRRRPAAGGESRRRGPTASARDSRWRPAAHGGCRSRGLPR
jgi:hypothetical protein